MICIILLLLIVVSYLIAPFPSYRSYFLLWKKVLFDKQPHVTFRIKSTLILKLIRYALLCPIYTLLWYIEELVFYKYKHLVIQPVFIIGVPRSGTTVLHRALAADEEHFFAIKHIEWRFPFITIQWLINKLHLSTMNWNHWSSSEAGKKASEMHPQTLFDWEEDGEFFRERFLHHMSVVIRFPYCDLLPFMDNFETLPKKEQDQMMAIYKKTIQKIMFLKGENKLFLSKEALDRSYLNALTTLFPDARFIVNIRPSSEFVSSFLELIRVNTLSQIGIDTFLIDGFKEGYTQIMRTNCLRVVKFIKSHECLLLHFKDIKEDPRAVIRQIYNYLNIDISPSYQQALDALVKPIEANYNYPLDTYTGFEEYDRIATSIETLEEQDK